MANSLIWTSIASAWILLAQSPTPQIAPSTTTTSPTPAPTIDVELINTQIKFLKDANEGLVKNFSNYVTTISYSVSFIVGFFAIVGVVGVVLFGKSLLDFNRTLRSINQEIEKIVNTRLKIVEQDVEAIVRKRVENEIAVLIRNRVDRLEAVLAREAILGKITIDYVLPTAQTNKLPKEIAFLQKRGFQTRPEWIPPSQFGSVQLNADVVVLDLFNSRFNEGDADEVIKDFVKKISHERLVLVIYIVGYQSKAINQVMLEGYYCAPAQSSLTLIARVVEASYVADALRS